MRLRYASFIVMLIILCVSNAQAEIYACKDVNGNTVYTDAPDGCVNAQEIKVDELPTLIPANSLTSTNSNQSAKNEEDKNAYTELVITSPNNDATIRDNQGNLSISF